VSICSRLVNSPTARREIALQEFPDGNSWRSLVVRYAPSHLQKWPIFGRNTAAAHGRSLLADLHAGRWRIHETTADRHRMDHRPRFLRTSRIAPLAVRARRENHCGADSPKVEVGTE
jgi:hypothetical protein